jgi:hypothetical protein
VPDAAFIQTVPGRHFIVALRLHGTATAFYDQTWNPTTWSRPADAREPGR